MTFCVVVEFLGHHVVVDAEDERVTNRVNRSFREMLANGPRARNPHVINKNVLEVRQSGRMYELSRDGTLIFGEPQLRKVQRVLRHEIICCFVRSRPELLWLHAGAAVLSGKAVLFVGRYGRGKSTLVTQLCARGWRYASDDIVPVNLATGQIFPFLLTPIVRQGIGTELPSERLTELRKARVSLPPSALLREPVDIGGIVFPTYRAGTIPRVEPYSPAAAALDIMREGINREENGSATVALCTRLVTEVPVLPLAFSDAAAAADLVIQELKQRPRAATATRRPSVLL